MPQENVTSNTKNAGRSFWACETCNFLLRVDANITMKLVRTPTKSNKRKASEQASSSPAAADNGKVAKKLMLTQRNKFSDSISAASGETYKYSMIGVRSDVDVAEAFATPAMVAAVKAEVLIKLKTELKDQLDNCKPIDRHKIARRFYFKSSGEHKIDEDVSDADCDFFLESLAEKSEIDNSYVLGDLPSPECTIKDVKSYVDLSKLLEKEGDVSPMSIDETKGATVVFVNPLDIIRFLVKDPTAVVIAPQKHVVFNCRPNLNDLVPILRGVSRIVYFGESTLMYFRDSKIDADVMRGCKKTNSSS